MDLCWESHIVWKSTWSQYTPRYRIMILFLCINYTYYYCKKVILIFFFIICYYFKISVMDIFLFRNYKKMIFIKEQGPMYGFRWLLLFCIPLLHRPLAKEYTSSATFIPLEFHELKKKKKKNFMSCSFLRSPYSNYLFSSSSNASNVDRACYLIGQPNILWGQF